MIDLDPFSVYFVTALVVNVSGIVFIIETILRRDHAAGKTWALSFLAAMLMTISYVIWDADANAWWAISVGNAAVVATSGCLWVGCRQYNDRRMRWSVVVVATAVLGAAGSVILGGPDGGDWAGAVWMFVSVVALTTAGAIECARGSIAAHRVAWIMTGALAFQALYFGARTVVFTIAGSESDLFVQWFATVTTGMLTIVISIVTLVVTSVLRAAEAPVRGYEEPEAAVGATHGILTSSDFRSALAGLTERAESRGERVGVIAVKVIDLDQISTAFGIDVVRAVTGVWRSGVRTHSPANAFVGLDGPSGMLVAIVVASSAEGRRQAGLIYRGLFDDLGSVSGGVIPVFGVGIGFSETTGYDSDALIDVARVAADEASRSVESSVLVGERGVMH